MPEGDSLHRAAQRLQVLVGESLEVEAPHPRAAGTRVAEQLDGKRLESVEAIGKNLLLRFEGGLVLRSHLRMKGRWWLQERGARRVGRPWLVLRGSRYEGVLWHGPVLELRGDRAARRLGPDILARPPDLDGIVARLRGADGRVPVGIALLDQRLVSGIGNMWKAEALWEARVSPWQGVTELDDEALRAVVAAAARLMRAALDEGRQARRVYGKAGRPCPRCGSAILSRGQGEDARTAYWCPTCQARRQESGS